MDRRRAGSPVYSRQWSGGSSSTGSSSPAMSPAHPHSRFPHSSSTIKRSQNVAAKAAAQRLAQVMASQSVSGDDDDDDDDEEDLGLRFRPPPPPASYSSNAALPAISVSRRPNRSPSPAVCISPLRSRVSASSGPASSCQLICLSSCLDCSASFGDADQIFSILLS